MQLFMRRRRRRQQRRWLGQPSLDAAPQSSLDIVDVRRQRTRFIERRAAAVNAPVVEVSVLVDKPEAERSHELRVLFEFEHSQECSQRGSADARDVCRHDFTVAAKCETCT